MHSLAGICEPCYFVADALRSSLGRMLRRLSHAPSRPPTRTPPTFQDSSEPSRLARRARLTALAERSAQGDSLPNSERPSDPTTGVPRRYARAVARLRFRLSTGEEVFKTIESDDQVPAEIDAFRNHQGEYGGEFFPADDGLWVLRLAVISMG